MEEISVTLKMSRRTFMWCLFLYLYYCGFQHITIKSKPSKN